MYIYITKWVISCYECENRQDLDIERRLVHLSVSVEAAAMKSVVDDVRSMTSERLQFIRDVAGDVRCVTANIRWKKSTFQKNT